MRPPVKLPTDIDKYQTPMIRPAMRAGASFVIALIPTGLSDSSPNVCSRYVSTSHIGLTFKPLAANGAAQATTTKPATANMSPYENFVGLDGSRAPSLSHSHANTGAKLMMNSGCSDW